MRSDVAPLPNTMGTPAAGIPQIGLLQRDQIIDRWNKWKFFLQQNLDALVVEFEQMVGCVNSRSEAAHHSFTPVGVTSHFQSQAVSLFHNRLDLFQGQRGTVDQRRVRLPHVNGAGEILGRINLDVIDTMQLGLPNGGASKPGRVEVFAFGKSIVKAHGLRIRIIVGGALVDGLADHLHARPLHDARIDRVAQIDGIEAAARIHIENGCEPVIRSPMMITI